MTTPRAADLRRVEAEVGILIRRVKRVLGERARLLHPDLHPATFFLLNHIVERAPIRAADLVGAFGMDKGGVSRQVQHLVDLGLVDRRPDPEDRRASLLAPTEEATRRRLGRGHHPRLLVRNGFVLSPRRLFPVLKAAHARFAPLLHGPR